jgi:exonuclease SbcC
VRPVRLEVQGFGAFREPTTIDFEGIELFALVGPTGAGKSTVIDALCFALYGTVPRYEDRRLVGAAITTGALEAKVSLTFDAAGRRYVATRVVRRGRTGGASTKEARLETTDGEVLAGAAKEVDAAVERLLGLTFEHFTRAVVLPQGEFARFLHDKPGARQDLLVRLLGFDVYERMMQRANTLATEHEAAGALARQRLDALDGCTEAEREVWAAWVAHYGELRAELRDARDRIAALGRDASAASAEAARSRDVLGAIHRVAVPEGVARVAEDRDGADAALAAAVAETTARVSALEAARGALAALGDRDPLVAARATHLQLASVRAELGTARAAAERAQRGAAEAVGAREQQEEHFEGLRAARAVHALARHLRAGEPCPLCEQPVLQVPSHAAPPEWKDAPAALERARAAAEVASAAAAAARQTVDDLTAREDQLGRQVADGPGHEEIDRRLAAMDGASAALDAAVEAERAARAAEERARAARAEVDRRVGDAGREFRRQRDAVLQVGAEPPPESGDLLTDWPALAAWAAAAAPVHAAAAQERDARAVELLAQQESGVEALRRRVVDGDDEIEVPPAATIDELADVVAAAEQQARAAVQRIAEGLAKRAGLEQTLAELGSEGQVARELARLLDARHFEGWLVAEALDLLVAGAAERLRDLSAGRFSLAFAEGSRDFLVVDHANADEARSVRTLSGGETFQASLARALALADQLGDLAADGAARLESIYLDEGFGSLDPDTLETVAETIESLGAGDRMVGVVTHVGELAARMPVQLRVASGPRTSTVERIDR